MIQIELNNNLIFNKLEKDLQKVIQSLCFIKSTKINQHYKVNKHRI